MPLVNIIIVFKSLDYNIPEQIFQTFHCFISGISDMVALMEEKTENYQTEFKTFEATSTSLFCSGVRNKGGVIHLAITLQPKAHKLSEAQCTFMLGQVA